MPQTPIQLSVETIQELLKQWRKIDLIDPPPLWRRWIVDPPPDPYGSLRDQLHRFLESDRERMQRLLQLEVELKLKETQIQQEMLNGVNEILSSRKQDM